MFMMNLHCTIYNQIAKLKDTKVFRQSFFTNFCYGMWKLDINDEQLKIKSEFCFKITPPPKKKK